MKLHRPNFIFLLADEIGYADLSCYGAKHMKTPNLDRLAAQGSRSRMHIRRRPLDRPTRRYVWKVAPAVHPAILRLMTAAVDPIRTASGDRVAQLRFECIAGKIEREPGLLEIPLANIARWLAGGHSARERLEGWRDMLVEARDSAGGMARLVALLRNDSAEAGEWKAFSPFAGVLTRGELDGLRWTSRH